MEEIDDIRCEMMAKSEEATSSSVIEDCWRAKDQVNGLISRIPIFNSVLETRFYESYTLLARNALENSPYHGADKNAAQLMYIYISNILRWELFAFTFIVT